LTVCAAIAEEISSELSRHGRNVGILERLAVIMPRLAVSASRIIQSRKWKITDATRDSERIDDSEAEEDDFETTDDTTRNSEMTNDCRRLLMPPVRCMMRLIALSPSLTVADDGTEDDRFADDEGVVNARQAVIQAEDIEKHAMDAVAKATQKWKELEECTTAAGAEKKQKAEAAYGDAKSKLIDASSRKVEAKGNLRQTLKHATRSLPLEALVRGGVGKALGCVLRVWIEKKMYNSLRETTVLASKLLEGVRPFPELACQLLSDVQSASGQGSTLQYLHELARPKGQGREGATVNHWVRDWARKAIAAFHGIQYENERPGSRKRKQCD
jgi:hypothetical protein